MPHPVTSDDFDTLALVRRANIWRTRAARATSEDVRRVCLTEAERCEQRLQRSYDTPAIFLCVETHAQPDRYVIHGESTRASELPGSRRHQG
jgi:hypothetical protein